MIGVNIGGRVALRPSVVIERGESRAADADLHGRTMFRIDHIDEAGAVTCAWRGDSYAEACRAAEPWAAAGLPVLDRTGGMNA